MKDANLSIKMLSLAIMLLALALIINSYNDRKIRALMIEDIIAIDVRLEATEDIVYEHLNP